MSTTPYVPPYFGSWEELARSFVNNPFVNNPYVNNPVNNPFVNNPFVNNPYVGGSAHAPHPQFASFLQQRLPHFGPPDPGPWEIANLLRTGLSPELNPQLLQTRNTTSLFLLQLAVRDLTSRLPKDQGAEITARLDQAISDEIDFVCGIVPRMPVPGTSPFAFTVAGELNLIGNIMHEGTLRTAVLQLAIQIATRATMPVTIKKDSRAAA